MEYVILWIVCGIGAAAIASSKDRSVFGWLIGGFLLGPIGLLIVGFMRKNIAEKNISASNGISLDSTEYSTTTEIDNNDYHADFPDTSAQIKHRPAYIDWKDWKSPIVGKIIYEIHLKGSSFNNDDGSSRQENLSKLYNCEYVDLKHDKQNKYDKNAILVISAAGSIGYIPKDQSKKINELISSDYNYTAIATIFGGNEDKNFGAVINLKFTPKGKLFKHERLDTNFHYLRGKHSDGNTFKNIGESVSRYAVIKLEIKESDKIYISNSKGIIFGKLNKCPRTDKIITNLCLGYRYKAKISRNDVVKEIFVVFDVPMDTSNF